MPPFQPSDLGLPTPRNPIRGTPSRADLKGRHQPLVRKDPLGPTTPIRPRLPSLSPSTHQPPFAGDSLGSHSRPINPHSPVAPLALTSDPPTSIRPDDRPLPPRTTSHHLPQAAVALIFDPPTSIRPPTIIRSPSNLHPPSALRPSPGLRADTSLRPRQPALPRSPQDHLSPQVGPSRFPPPFPPIPHAPLPNGLRLCRRSTSRTQAPQRPEIRFAERQAAPI